MSVSASEGPSGGAAASSHFPSPASSSAAAAVSSPPPPLPPLSSSAASSAASAVSACWSEWRSVGLDAIRPSLERSALSLADEEDRASAARLSLSGQSKALKRAAADDKLAMLGAVVKAYQEEINALTRRAKTAETAYLSLYQLVLLKVRDPTPALQQALTALQQAAAMEAEWAKCRQQADELDRELSTLKNQDATLRRLEAQLREVDKRTEQRVREAVAEHNEASRQHTAHERREAAEREAALRLSLDECRQSLSQQAASHQQQQDAHFRESEKHEKAAREAERELDSLRADNERLQHTLQALNSRTAEDRERQRDGLAAAQSASHSTSAAASTAQLEAEVQSLRDALSAVQLDNADSHDGLLRERTERDVERQAAAENIERLTLQVAQWKHRALTSGSSSGQQRSDSAARSEDATKESKQERSSAQQAALVAELAATRAQNEQLEALHSEADSRIQQLSNAVQEAERTSVQQLQLIAQLEADLTLLQQQARTGQQTATEASPFSRPPFASLSSLAAPASVNSAAGANSPPSCQSAVDASASGGSSAPSGALPFSSSSSAPCCSCSSLLRIVSGQRDRLRVRVEQLERELTDRQAALVEARSARQQLQDDNVALYEKLQYVKAFEQQQQQQQPGNRGGSRGAWQQHSSSSAASHSLLVDSAGSGSGSGSASSERRYAKLYAESLNPFSAWKSGQLLASERSLPPSERVTLNCARLLFSRRAARSFAFFYALVLHLLVFAVLWTHTVSDHCALSAEEDA